MRLRDFLYNADDHALFRIYTDPDHGTLKAHSATQLLIECSNAILDRQVAIFGTERLVPNSDKVIVIYVLLKPEGK